MSVGKEGGDGAARAPKPHLATPSSPLRLWLLSEAAAAVVVVVAAAKKCPGLETRRRYVE
jgi:hypothetical protein